MSKPVTLETPTLRMGRYEMSVTEDVLQRLELLCDSDYMEGYLDEIITRIVDIYEGQDTPGDILTSDDANLISGINESIRITAFCIPFLGVGLPSTFMYLGMGKAKYSLFWTVINELVCAVSATYLLGFVLNWGLYGIWWGFVLGRGIASICNFIFSRFTINRLIWIRKRTSL